MEEWKELDGKEFEIKISTDCNGIKKAYYRKRQPKQPTHEEIMTKWWKDDLDNWVRVTLYKSGTYYISGTHRMHNTTWFTNRESAEIPPEAK